MSKFLLSLTMFLLFAVYGFSSSTHTSQKKSHTLQKPITPYKVEEVNFENPEAGVSLSGTLTIPHSIETPPAVVLLHGSAPLDRDVCIFGHKLFLAWADLLTKQGIAVLRFDKRGVGKSTGNYDTSTVEDFASDAVAAVEYLRTRTDINKKQIGLVGHSEGGMTAPLAASRSNAISFLVLMAGPCINAEELLFEQAKNLQRVDRVSEEMIALNEQLLATLFGLIRENENRLLCAKKMEEVLNGLDISQQTVFQQYYGPPESAINLFNSEWLRYWLHYDPCNVLKNIQIPVLALNGELDYFVSSTNLFKIAEALEEAGNQNYTILEIPKLNHMFQKTQTGSLKEYPLIEEPVSHSALNVISHWILEKTSRD